MSTGRNGRPADTFYKPASNRSDRIVMRVGEALVAGGPPGTAAELEIVIGELDGPVGQAFAQLIGDQVKGHSRVLAIMNTDIMVKPATLMVSKVTVKKERYPNILMGAMQAAIANGVLDAVRQALNTRPMSSGLLCPSG